MHNHLIKWGVKAGLARFVCFQALPTIVGASGGYGAISVADWRYPIVAFALVSGTIQLFIALMRSWFTERRELIETMKAMLLQQEQHFLNLIKQEKEERHDLANRLNTANWRVYCYKNNIPYEEPPDIYETDIVHRAKS